MGVGYCKLSLSFSLSVETSSSSHVSCQEIISYSVVPNGTDVIPQSRRSMERKSVRRFHGILRNKMKTRRQKQDENETSKRQNAEREREREREREAGREGDGGRETVLR